MWALITSIFGGLGGWLLKGPLDRAFTSLDKSIDNETERQKIKGNLAQEYLRAQIAVLTGPGWWFPLFFIVPLGTWFAAVCIYSMLFCQGCVLPQTWTIAALPPPLDEWSGAIVASLFLGGFGKSIMATWRGK